MDGRARNGKNDKCVGQSIRSCQTDGKLESGVTLRQIDTIRSTKMNSDLRVCVATCTCARKKTNRQITARTHRRKGRGGRKKSGEDVRNVGIEKEREKK